jgi:hypothetical protein
MQAPTKTLVSLDKEIIAVKRSFKQVARYDLTASLSIGSAKPHSLFTDRAISPDLFTDSVISQGILDRYTRPHSHFCWCSRTNMNVHCKYYKSYFSLQQKKQLFINTI